MLYRISQKDACLAIPKALITSPTERTYIERTPPVRNRLLLQRGVPRGACPPKRRIHDNFTRVGCHSSLDKELYQQQEGPEEEEFLGESDQPPVETL